MSEDFDGPTLDDGVSLWTSALLYVAFRDRVFILIGTILFIFIGVMQQCHMYLLGSSIHALGTGDFDGSLRTNISIYAGLTVAAFLIGGLATFILQFTADKQVNNFKIKYAEAVLHLHLTSLLDKYVKHSALSFAQLDLLTLKVKDGSSRRIGLLCQYGSQVVCGYLLAFAVEWKLTLMMSVGIPVVVGIVWMSKHRRRRIKESVLEEYGVAEERAREVLERRRVVEAFGLEDHFGKMFEEQIMKCSERALRYNTYKALVWSAFTGLLLLTATLGWRYASHLVGVELHASLGTNSSSAGNSLGAFSSLLLATYSATQLYPNVNFLRQSCRAIDTILTFIRFANCRKNADRKVFRYSRTHKTTDEVRDSSIPEKRGRIKFDRVKYVDPESPYEALLEKVDFEVGPGEVLAILGPPRCGKSVILKLLLRFCERSEGMITIDDKDIRKMSSEYLRSQIAWASHEAFGVLAAESIEDNIRIGRVSASSVEVSAAGQMAKADSFISFLPEGYRSLATGLSTSQKKLIHLARSLFLRVDCPILLIDDICDTDQQEVELISNLHTSRPKTIIIVTNRPQTLQLATSVLVLGRLPRRTTQVYQCGPPQQLTLQSDGVFAQYLQALSNTNDLTFHTAHLAINLCPTLNQPPSHQSPLNQPPLHPNTQRLIHQFVVAQLLNVPNRKRIEGFCGLVNVGPLMVQKSVSQKTLGSMSRRSILVEDTELESIGDPRLGRFWWYTKPDILWIALGSLSSMGVGTILPLLTMLIVRCVESMYQYDLTVPVDVNTDRLETDANHRAFLFVWLTFYASVMCCAYYECWGRSGICLVARVRSIVFNSIINQDSQFFTNTTNDQLLNVISSHCPVAATLTGESLGRIIKNFVLNLASLIIALHGSLKLALPPILIHLHVIPAIFLKTALGKENLPTLQSYSSSFVYNDIATQTPLIVANNYQSVILEKYRQCLEEEVRRRRKKVWGISLASAFTYGIYGLANAVMFSAARGLVRRGEVRLLDAFQTILAISTLIYGVGRVATFKKDSAAIRESCRSVFDYIDSRTDDSFSGTQDFTLKGKIQYDRVTFRYPSSLSQPLLKEVSFNIKPRQKIVLLGPPECGKWTLINFLERFYDVNAPVALRIALNELVEATEGLEEFYGGSVKVDDVDIRYLDKRTLRRQIGYVGRDYNLFFSATVEENIGLGRLGSTSDEIKEAARQAGILNTIEALPYGFQTRVVPSMFEESERRRICIARALLRSPEIVVGHFVATSTSIKTSSDLQEDINVLREADQIVLLSTYSGCTRVVECGRLDDLCQNPDSLLHRILVTLNVSD